MAQERGIIKRLDEGKDKIAVIGLGYVGLPLALEFAKYWKVVGYDIRDDRVAMMNKGVDPSRELPSEAFENKMISFTTNPKELKQCSVFVLAVPTPVDDRKVPNLQPLLSASETIGKHLSKNDIVIYESTVYPGCTEEDCVPVLEKNSGLTYIADFKVGYSPERINPGDKERSVEKIIKVVSACDNEALEDISAMYEKVITGGIFKAASIKVAEAAKAAIQTLMSEEFIVHTDFIGDDFQALLKEVKSLTAGEEGIQSILKQADDEAKTYAKKHIGQKKATSKRS